jgi:tetratricopeptide (TPR) repeat protein
MADPTGEPDGTARRANYMTSLREQMIARGLITQAPPRPSLAGTHIFLDESGSFAKEEPRLVAGLVVPEGGQDLPPRLLQSAIAAMQASGGAVPEEGLHGTELRKNHFAWWKVLLDTLLHEIEAHPGLAVFGGWDRTNAKYRDPNLGHAAVLARSLAQHLATLPAPGPLTLTVAGRSTMKGQWINTETTIEHILRARLEEELALVGTSPPEIRIIVRHIRPKEWKDEAQAGLLIADLLCNLLFSGKGDHAARAKARYLKGCPLVFTKRGELDRGKEMLSQLGPVAFLVWQYGPAAPLAAKQHESLADEVLSSVARRGELAPALEALGDALERQLRVHRDLVGARATAERLLGVLGKVKHAVTGVVERRHRYRALSGLLDIANHRGNLEDAHGVVKQEETLRQRFGLGALVDSLELRNRAAERWVNAFDFATAARELESLIKDIEQASKLLRLGSSFPTHGRILSHRAQVHHYLGEDEQALRLYDEAGCHYDDPLDRTILQHHRIRSLLGAGLVHQAWQGLAGLGVTEDLRRIDHQQPFLDDLVLLATRVALGRQQGGEQLRRKLATVAGLADEIAVAAQSPYPGLATMRNLARLAARGNARAACVTALHHGATLATDSSSSPTLCSVGLAFALEGVENAAHFTLKDEATGLLALARSLLERLLHASTPATLRDHFAPAAKRMKAWRGVGDAVADREALRRIVRRVPFGAVGGMTRGPL